MGSGYTSLIGPRQDYPDQGYAQKRFPSSHAALTGDACEGKPVSVVPEDLRSQVRPSMSLWRWERSLTEISTSAENGSFKAFTPLYSIRHCSDSERGSTEGCFGMGYSDTTEFEGARS